MRRHSARAWIAGAALLALVCAAVAPAAVPAAAQIGGPTPTTHIFMTSVASDDFPRVAAQLYATDATGLPIASLQPTELTVAVDGVEVAPDRYTLAPTSGGAQSVVIVLDTTTNEAAWASALTSAQNLLNQLAPGDAAAIVTVGDVTQVRSTLSSEIQTARDALAAVATVAPQGTQSLANQAIMDGLSLFAVGAAQEPAIAHNRRSLILLTERAGSPDNPSEGQPDTATVAQFAQQEGVGLLLYAWGSAAGAAQDLLDLAQNTGGRFTPLATAGDANGHFQTLPALLRPGYLLTHVSDLPANGGAHTLLVAGAGSRPVQGTFAAQPRPLEVAITQPEAGAVVSGNVVVAVSASAPTTITSMSFALANGAIITTTNGPVGGILWDTADLPAGAQSIIVQAVDAVGNTGASERTVTVRPPIVLAVQTSGDRVQVGDPAWITATVDSALQGVTVEAFLGRTQVGVAADPVGPVGFAVQTDAFVPGRYALVVRAVNSGGYTATDSSQVLTLTPAPVRPTPAQDMASAMWVWLNRWWLPVLLGVAGLLLLWWLLAALLRALRRREAAETQQALQVHPQMRMLLTNSGNVRTRYRLRAQALEGDYKFTFIHNGAALVAPAVEHVVQTGGARASGAAAGSTNGGSTNGGSTNGGSANGRGATLYAPAGAQATGSASAVAATAGQAAKTAAVVGEQASMAGSFAGRFLMTAGDFIPGALGDSLKRAGGSVRKVQTTAAKTQFEIADARGDMQELSTMSKTAGKAAVNATGTGAGAQPAPARYAAQPAPVAAGNSAFALQPSGGRSADSATRNGTATTPARWVETPPVAPGDTIGVDLFVQPAQGRPKNKRVNLRLYAIPSEADGARPSVDEVSVLL